MSSLHFGSARWLPAWIPNTFVLILLISLGYFGHRTHWKFPRFADLTRSSGGNSVNAAPAETTGGRAGSSSADPRLADERRAGTTDGHGDAKTVSTLPIIRLPSAEAVHKAGIVCTPVQERQMDEYVSSYGIVTYDETKLAQLSPRVPGIAVRVEKEVGDHVLKGDLLAILDSLDVGKAKAEYLQAVVNSDVKRMNLRHLRAIANSIAERQLREAEADEREARVQRFNAQQALINLGLPIAPIEAAGMSDEELARKIQFLGLPPQVASEYEQESSSANFLPLLSPLEGMVIRREIVTGEVVDPSHAQFVVADVRKMWLKLNVGKEDAMRLAIGQEVFFSADGLPGEVPSRLSWIGTEVDEKTRKVPVRAVIENRSLSGEETGYATGQWLLRANMFGTGRIRIRRRPATNVVPNTAVQWDGTSHLVFVPRSDGTTFEPRRVRLGGTRDGYSEIISGAELGEQVVSAGSYVLKSELMGVEE